MTVLQYTWIAPEVLPGYRFENDLTLPLLPKVAAHLFPNLRRRFTSPDDHRKRPLGFLWGLLRSIRDRELRTEFVECFIDYISSSSYVVEAVHLWRPLHTACQGDIFVDKSSGHKRWLEGILNGDIIDGLWEVSGRLERHEIRMSSTISLNTEDLLYFTYGDCPATI